MLEAGPIGPGVTALNDPTVRRCGSNCVSVDFGIRTLLAALAMHKVIDRDHRQIKAISNVPGQPTFAGTRTADDHDALHA
ncbi:hypothetical protein JI749_06825 [Devosia oryziradicis]|uniref:Uncharacterized protein n=1 Tax=Devosia oryziradicis TaxID=2801335 RepID=A0ABX7C3S8_9HYPH|nr:hypothetical protein [Devosia oryziradicis]QQR37315.1 hypothetical protein JI749_06825 [Devosia oryziradicis]